MALPILKRYAIAFSQYKWFGFGAFVIVLGAAGFVAMQPSPAERYRGAGHLRYTTPPVTFSQTGSVIQEQGRKLPESVLKSENVIEAVSKQVNEDPKVVEKNTRLRFVEREDSEPFIEVYFDDDNRQRAGEVTGVLMKTMIEQSRLINSSALRGRIAAIEERLPQVIEELRQAERELEQFEREEGVSILVAKSGNLAESIVGNQAQQRQIRLQLEGIDAQIASLEQRLGLSADQAYVSQALSADPIIADLRAKLHAVESQLELLSRDFRAEHPQMIQLRKQQEAYNELLEQRAQEVIGGDGLAAPILTDVQIRKDSSLDPARQQLAQTLVNLQTQRQALAQQLQGLAETQGELQREYESIPNKTMERDRLAGQVALKKNFYDQMQASLADARLAEAETTSSLMVKQPPKVEEITPKTQPAILIFAIGGLLGILLGNVLIFVLSLLEGKFYTMEEIRGALQQQDVRILGILPNLPPSEGTGILPVILNANSPYLEFYEQLRTNLRRLGEKPPKVLLMTSVARSEGKSTCAYNLAIAAARAGKRTVLIEADLRSPSAARSVRVAPDPQAEIEPLRYYAQYNQCIHLAPDVENLYVIPSPGPVRNAAELLESSEMRQLLEDIRFRFDFAVLDAPSLSSCNDALLLEGFTDGTIVVTRPRYTSSGLLTEYVEPLTESEETQLLGAVINGADIEVQFEDRDLDAIQVSLPGEKPMDSLPPQDRPLPPKMPSRSR
ncbi:GumC family protein [Oxynema aestuarii]|uniref:non-specific protein-tyrosine kinase n=1 Tax=Oxynema aestuarii AP17 TaxID=2064643 RepID=A0A6H1TY49_9CYAN|nr:AAA family ATPase [Oxynema aestuarii]QIZ71511.1 AAA family ATPase [Oxynema aestuarii AP17]